MSLIEQDEFVQVIDSQRTITLNTTTSGSFVLAVEDPHAVAIIEVSREDLAALRNDIEKRLRR